MAALGMTGAAAGAAYLTGCTTTNSAAITATVNLAQTDYLNFLLNFKYLEATFYSFITQGADLSGAAVTGSGAITGAPGKLTFTGSNASQITDMLNEIYYDETSHVTALRSILGDYAVPRPAINLAAAGAVNASSALSIARVLEDVAVTACAGAAGALSSTSLSYLFQILAVESFHSGALRLVSIQNPTIAVYIAAGDGKDVPPADPGSAAAAAAGPTSAGAFFETTGTTTATAASPAGLAFTRTTSQVLAIAFSPGSPAGSGTTKGGFFPGGVNGLINTV
jgi:hypothetical protein